MVAGLFQATSLPFIVAATAIGRDLDLIGGAESAELIAAGLLSVLLFPLAGSLLLRAQPAMLIPKEAPTMPDLAERHEVARERDHGTTPT